MRTSYFDVGTLAVSIAVSVKHRSGVRLSVRLSACLSRMCEVL